MLRPEETSFQEKKGVSDTLERFYSLLGAFSGRLRERRGHVVGLLIAKTSFQEKKGVSDALERLYSLPGAFSGRLRERRGRVGLLMKVFVFFPTLLVFGYLLLLHSDMYLSHSMFAVRSGGLQPASDTSGLGGLLSSYLPGGSSDSQIVLAFITSQNMLERVAADLDLIGHYAGRSRDPWSRLRQKPTREQMLAYWQWIVKPSFDLERGVISVEVKAYDREMARIVNSAVLRHSEALVNDMNSRAREDTLRLAVEEVGRGERRVAEAAENLRGFRDSRALLDPAATARGLETVIAGLEAEAAKTGAELEAAQKTMRADSLIVAEISNRLHSLQAQIERENARLAGLDAEKSPLSSLVGEFTALRMEEEFANKQLVSAMSMYELARIQTAAQTRYVTPIQPPTLAEESEYPRVFLFTLAAFAAFLTGLGLVSLTVAAVRDHMGV
jgi:capsular polysaccharide transport system permease protein